MRWWLALVPSIFIGGCILDVTGTAEPPTPTGTTTGTTETGTSSGTGTATTTGTGPGTTTGTGSGSTTSTTTGAGGGGGGAPICGDGIVEPPEDCEDGNTTGSDGCSDDCTIEATCGNGTIEPGEECDSTVECSSCTVQAPSPCVAATKLPVGDFDDDTTGSPVTAFGTVVTDFAGTDCDDYQSAPLKLYRHQNGPYPSGLAVIVHGTGGSFDDAFVWSYVGCAAEPAACSDDAHMLISGSDAAMFTPVLAPHTVLYVGIAEWSASQVGSFHAYARPFRWGDWFSYVASNPGFQLGGSWAYVPNQGLVVNTHLASSLDAATSPSFYVAGIDTLEITFRHILSVQNGTSASVEVSFDGAAWVATDYTNQTLSDTAQELETASVAVPDGALDARFRFVFSDDGNSNGSWHIGGIIAGPAL